MKSALQEHQADGREASRRPALAPPFHRRCFSVLLGLHSTRDSASATELTDESFRSDCSNDWVLDMRTDKAKAKRTLGAPVHIILAPSFQRY